MIACQDYATVVSKFDQAPFTDKGYGVSISKAGAKLCICLW